MYKTLPAWWKAAKDAKMKTMRYAIILIFAFFCTFPAVAQEITPQPICFTVKNTAPYKVYGQIATNYYTTPDGTQARHTGTFRLEKKDTTDSETGHAKDRREFCVSGPFYPNRKVELTIRTLVPIFTCQTSVELGDIVIHGRRKDDGTTKTWATCY